MPIRALRLNCWTVRNRIAKGKITIDGKEYQLAINNYPNSLHGGAVGFSKKIWNVDGTAVTNDGPALTLTLVSKDGEENYPGTVTLTVVYTLTNNDELSIVYTGTTDKTTVLNPTNHSYFNLTGDMNNTILDHEVMIQQIKQLRLIRINFPGKLYGCRRNTDGFSSC